MTQAILRARPNHSIEGTNNGGSSLGFLSRLVPPSFAPHVKRYGAKKIPTVRATHAKGNH